jgi:uncharacterized protein YsxB (DUF464 family)
MVSIVIRKNRQGRILGFRCLGHAEFSENGLDIVCSAISVLTQTTIIALDELVRIPLTIEQDPEAGLIDCGWDAAIAGPEQEQAQLLVKTMCLGLREIERIYPENMSLSELEVLDHDPF